MFFPRFCRYFFFKCLIFHRFLAFLSFFRSFRRKTREIPLFDEKQEVFQQIIEKRRGFSRKRKEKLVFISGQGAKK